MTEVPRATRVVLEAVEGRRAAELSVCMKVRAAVLRACSHNAEGRDQSRSLESPVNLPEWRPDMPSFSHLTPPQAQYLQCYVRWRCISSPVSMRLSDTVFLFSNPRFSGHHATNSLVLLLREMPSKGMDVDATPRLTKYRQGIFVTGSETVDTCGQPWRSTTIFIAPRSHVLSAVTMPTLDKLPVGGLFKKYCRPKVSCVGMLDFVGVFAAADGTEVVEVGYAALLDGGNGCVLMVDLWVDEPYRRRGAARALVETAVASAGGRQLCVACFDENQAAVGLFTSMSFETAGKQWVLDF